MISRAALLLSMSFAPDGPPIEPMPNAEMTEDGTAIATWPVEVWFDGDRSVECILDFGPRRIEKITLDPRGRFPDRDPDDNVWTRSR